jgi:hypothetical protein
MSVEFIHPGLREVDGIIHRAGFIPIDASADERLTWSHHANYAPAFSGILRRWVSVESSSTG